MRVNGETRVLGIFGYPVRHSLSPIMQNAAITALGINYIYVPYEVDPEDLGQALRGLKALGISGVNVTVPHKEKVIPFLDLLTEDASIIGAVNTIVNRDGRLIGYNTDAGGYIRSLSEEAGFNPAKKKVLVIGAGGAARGVVAGLAGGEAGEILISNRTPENAERLAQEFSKKFKGTSFSAFPLYALKERELLSSCDLIVNTTSAGLEGEEIDIDFEHTRKDVLVSDIIYRPAVTPFLKKAGEHKRKTIGGLGMLVHQGALSLEIWTSKKAPAGTMRKALEDHLAA